MSGNGDPNERGHQPTDQAIMAKYWEYQEEPPTLAPVPQYWQNEAQNDHCPGNVSLNNTQQSPKQADQSPSVPVANQQQQPATLAKYWNNEQPNEQPSEPSQSIPQVLNEPARAPVAKKTIYYQPAFFYFFGPSGEIYIIPDVEALNIPHSMLDGSQHNNNLIEEIFWSRFGKFELLR